MRTLIYVLATTVIAGFAPSVASAADLGGYEESDTVIERSPPVVERERIIERRYYAPDEYYYDDAPVVAYYGPRYRRPYPYYAAYPDRFRPYYHHRYWRHHHRHW